MGGHGWGELPRGWHIPAIRKVRICNAEVVFLETCLMEQRLKINVCIGFNFRLAARRWGYFWTGTLGVINQLAVAEGVGLPAVCADRHTTVSAGPSNISVEFALGAETMAQANTLLEQGANAVRQRLQSEFAEPASQVIQSGNPLLRAIVVAGCVLGDQSLLDIIWRNVPGEFERQDAFGMDPLMWSCATGSGATLRWAVGKRFNLAGCNAYRWGCAELAAANGNGDIAILAGRNGSPQLGAAMRKELENLDLLGISSVTSAVALTSKSWQGSLPASAQSGAAAEPALSAAAVRAARTLNPSDAKQLERLRRTGAVMTNPCILRHLLAFPSRTAAEAARDRVTRYVGTTVSGPTPDDRLKRWALRTTCKVVPTDGAVARLCNVLRFIASECGGEYDGWEAEEL